jgi:perosamine synthetase
MAIFRDEAMAERAAQLRDHGMTKMRRYWHEEVGYNYRMTNLQAAVGVAQMERLDEFVAAKRRIGSYYRERLGRLGIFTAPGDPDWGFNSYWLYTTVLGKDSSIGRDELLLKLLRQGVETRPVFYPLHVMPPYARYGKEDGFPVATETSRTGISLPSSVSLKDDDLDAVCSAIESLVGTRKLVAQF